jgi:hypothetical protein
VTDAAALLRSLAVPRLTGSEGHAAAQHLLTHELARRGLAVMAHRFALTDAPLRRAALAAEFVAVAALTFMVGALAGEPLLGMRIAVIPLVMLAGVLVFGGRSRRRAWGVNLLGQRAGSAPKLWLVAHYDSKGQRLSMATRLIGALCLALQVPALMALAVVWANGARGVELALLALPALVGGIVLAAADLRNDSPGAVDNASGVVAALASFDRLAERRDVAIALTDGEEWGLLGARALVREHASLFRGAAIVNFDGLDDRGRAIVLAHRAGPLGRVVARVLGARRVPWLPVLVDGIALQHAGTECLTIMRGDWGTMRRVHTPADAPDVLTPQAAVAAAGAVAEAMRGL